MVVIVKLPALLLIVKLPLVAVKSLLSVVPCAIVQYSVVALGTPDVLTLIVM